MSEMSNSLSLISTTLSYEHKTITIQRVLVESLTALSVNVKLASIVVN